MMPEKIAIKMLIHIWPYIRPILKNAINDSDQCWDDALMTVIDQIIATIIEHNKIGGQ